MSERIVHVADRRHTSSAAPRRVGMFERIPKWLNLIPMVLQWLWLGLRHRSLTLPSAVNPRITAGGLVGDTKSEYFACMGPRARARRAIHIALGARFRSGLVGTRRTGSRLRRLGLLQARITGVRCSASIGRDRRCATLAALIRLDPGSRCIRGSPSQLQFLLGLFFLLDLAEHVVLLPEGPDVVRQPVDDDGHR